jgi:RNA-binding protein YhbY
MDKLKQQAVDMVTQLRIGKNGLSKPMLDEIEVHLKKRKMVKIKFLQSYIEDKDRKQEAANIANLTHSELVYITGNVFVLHKGK